MVLKCYSNGIQCFHMFFYTLYFFFKIPFKEIPKGVATLIAIFEMKIFQLESGLIGE